MRYLHIFAILKIIPTAVKCLPDILWAVTLDVIVLENMRKIFHEHT